jgi:hypothetical protein
MSDGSESEGPRSPGGGGQSHARGGALKWSGRRISVSLCIASVVSVGLVLVVGLLIAFMQYQSRLLRAHPGLTPGQLVYYVETERNIRKSFDDLKDLSQQITTETPAVSYALNGIQYRIDRICSLFKGDADAKAEKENVQKCAAFLRNIPFEGTKSEPPADGASRPIAALTPETVATSAPAQDAPPSKLDPPARELLRSIQAQFVKVMGDRKIGEVNLSTIIELYSSDMDVIAQLNQRYWGTLHTPYNFKLEKRRALCDHIDRLASIIRLYRKIDSGCEPARPPAAPPPPESGPEANRSQPPALRPEPANVARPAWPDGATVGRGSGERWAQAPPPASSGPAMPPAAPSGPEAGAGPVAPHGPVPGGPIISSEGPRAGGSIIAASAGVAADGDQRAFEFVSHYQFYERLSLGYLKDILISPSDFLALMLVFFAGILGAVLRIVFFTYVSGKDPNLRNVVIGPILGLICALVVYILFRAGFIAITDHPQSADTAVLSPFLIAILAMAAGLLSERAIDLFRKTTGSWLGSVEASQAGRWAVHLRSLLEERNITVENLAQRLDVSAQKLEEWADEKDLVPYDKQRDIAFVLGMPIRRIFTDIDPRAGVNA